MKASLPTTDHQNAKNYGRDKETVSTYRVVVRTKTGPVCPVDCRVYMGRSSSASMVYASIWVYSDTVNVSGTGSAGGGGYHKESAAIDEAIKSAGIKLSKSIHGAGESAIREALTAITRALGYRGKLIIV